MKKSKCKMQNEEKDDVAAGDSPILTFDFCILHFAFYPKARRG